MSKPRRGSHWLSMAAAGVVACAFFVVNVSQFSVAGKRTVSHGWPLTVLERQRTSDDPDSMSLATQLQAAAIRFLPLLANVVVGAVLTVSSFFCTERFTRAANLPQTLRMSTLLALTGAVATCTAAIHTLPWNWPDALRTFIWFTLLLAIGAVWLTAFELVRLLMVRREATASGSQREET